MAAINGSASNNGTSGTSATVTLTTTLGGLWIILVVATSEQNSGTATAATVSGVSSTHTTGWTKRKGTGSTGIGTTGGGLNVSGNLDIWYGKAAAALTSEVITATLTGDAGGQPSVTMLAWGVSGAGSVSPWDTNVSLPAAASSASASSPSVSGVSTSQANDLILSVCLIGNGESADVNHPAAGFTDITFAFENTDVSASDASYQAVSALQSSISVGWGALEGNHSGVATGWLQYADAISGDDLMAQIVL